MATSSIHIHELNNIPSIAREDYFPLNKSSSNTTYKGTFTQLSTLLSTGSFTGIFVGYFTGSGSGPHLLGTSSYAISSSYAKSASYASNANSASYSLSSSYAPNIPNITGSGTSNFIAMWTPNSTTLGSSPIYKHPSNNYVTCDGYGFKVVSYNLTSFTAVYEDTYASQIGMLHTNSSRSLSTYPDCDLFGISVFSGSWFMWSPSGSQNLKVITASILQQGTSSLNREVIWIENHKNDIYYFPYFDISSANRSSKLGIGVRIPGTGSGHAYDHPELTSSLSARLQIFCYTGNNSDFTASTINYPNPDKALYIQSGVSGSVPVDLMYVSASTGNTYIKGDLTLSGSISSSNVMSSSTHNTIVGELPINVGGTTYYIKLYST